MAHVQTRYITFPIYGGRRRKYLPAHDRTQGFEIFLRHVAEVYNPDEFSWSEYLFRQEASPKDTTEENEAVEERIHLRSFDRYDCVDM